MVPHPEFTTEHVTREQLMNRKKKYWRRQHKNAKANAMFTYSYVGLQRSVFKQSDTSIWTFQN